MSLINKYFFGTLNEHAPLKKKSVRTNHAIHDKVITQSYYVAV